MLGHRVMAPVHAGPAVAPLGMQQPILALRPQCPHKHSNCSFAASAALATAAAQKHICRSTNATLSPSSSSSSSSGTAIELRRTLLMRQLQDVLPSTTVPEMPPDLLQSSSSSSSFIDHGYRSADPNPSSSSSSSSSKQQSSSSKHSKGFAAAAGSSSSSKSRQQQQQGRQQQLAADDPCPCHSGLNYKDCCRPFLSGAAIPRSALELVTARFTAARTGNIQYLVSTAHPDSSLALGGARDMASRAKRLCGYYKANKMEIVGMAHCPGDQPGTWVVLTILQANAGDFAGEKIPSMELIVKRNWTDTKVTNNNGYNKGLWGDDSAAGSSNSSNESTGSQDWMYFKNMNSFPDNGQAEVLVQLIQRHCPEVLNDGSSNDQQQQQQGMAEREVCFVWTAPNFHVGAASSSSSSSSSSEWYVDLLKSSVEPIGSSRQQQHQAVVNGHQHDQAMSQYQLFVPPGVFIMDNYLEQRAKNANK